MRVPLSWLRAYCDPGLPTGELAERLASIGLQPERIDRVGVGDVSAFVVGRVLSCEKHPDADRLSVCMVDDGSGEERQIVCGAPNVAAGQTVAVARPGAVMPDGQTLGEAKLRGVKSSGMILAEDEVGISQDHAETMVLPDDLAPGTPLTEALVIEDEVLDLEVNPNRPDALSVYGVARDVHAFTRAPLAEDPTARDAEPSGSDSADDHVTITIDPEICLRFTARVFEDVKVGPSPLWLKQRLTAAGQRPISNVVDITNYVLLATGQPLHSFDLDRVRGGRIDVRRAHDGEKMTTLDDVERTFDSSMALVCDAEGPSGIGGVMGGQISEVSDSTTRVLMEAATWVGPNILQTSKKLALRSEASARFEKQLHPDLAIAAQRLAARLMVELCGARLVPGTVDVYPHPVAPRVVELRYERIERLLGDRIPEDEVAAILERLGFELCDAGEGAWHVTVPYWRDGDVQREADLIEEVGRIHGLDSLPATLPERAQAVGRLTPEQRLRRLVEDALRDRGLSEAISWSFTRPEAMEQLRLGDVPLLRIDNPLSEDQRVMRPLLLPGLLDSAAHNAARGRGTLALFESAHVYRPAGNLSSNGDKPQQGTTPAMERHHIGALMLGGGGFRALKGILEGVLETAGAEWWVEPAERPFLHPGRSASILAGDERKLGWIGELHPMVLAEWDLSGTCTAFEIDFDLLAEIVPDARQYEPISPFPAVIQDIAVVVDDDVLAGVVHATVAEAGGDLLERVTLFDEYRGEQVGEGKKSLALRLEFRAPDRTLTDEEVAERREAIERELGELGGRLRG
ncbi:MAG TPA: phenylalanine--tRNA ligase subunit beta [Thermoleophilaceae bacterium]